MANNNEIPIRTLYVSPIVPKITHQIKRYFEQYGEVEHVRFHKKDDFQYGFVQFKMAECANAALANVWHRIGNRKVNVKAGHLHHQPDYIRAPVNPLLLPPDQNSDSHILNALNDDCLREVFQKLNWIDLSKAAQVCVRFNQHAKVAFVGKYKDLNLKFLPNKYQTIKKKEAENLLQNFGEAIQSLDIDSFILDLNVPFLRIASKYCTKLKVLKLHSFDFKGNLKKIRPLLQRLEELHFSDCECYYGMKFVLSNCLKLKVLRFNSCDMGQGAFIKQHFPKLEEASLNESYNFDESTLNSFIIQNPALMKLSINSNGIIKTTKPIKLIGQNLRNLLELELGELNEVDNLDEAFQTFGQLRALKVLKLDFYAESIAPLMHILATNKVPIEHLKLINGNINGYAIGQISELKKVKTLELIEMFGKIDDELMIELAENLPNLEEMCIREPPSESITTKGLKKMLTHAKKLSALSLELIDSVTIDVDDYKAMIKTIQSRANKFNLVIKIKGTGDKVNIPVDIVNENRAVLFIDETIEYPIEDISFSDEDDSWLSDWAADSRFDDSSYDDIYDHYSDADSELQFGVGFLNGQLFYLG